MQRSAADVMCSPAHWVAADAALEEVDRRMQDDEVSALAVSDDDGALLGVISRTDLIRVARSVRPRNRALVLPDLAASDVMTRDDLSVMPSTPLERVADLIAARQVHRIFVVDGQGLCGVVATRELMEAAVLDRLDAPLSSLMSPTVTMLGVEAMIGEAIDRMRELRMHGIIVARRGLPVGVVTMEDVLIAQHWPESTKLASWMHPRPLCLPEAMPLHRAAAHALAMDQRHIVVMGTDGMVGVVTAVDFAGAYARRHQPDTQ